MSDNNGVVQLGLLPNMDTPVSELRQRQRPINNGVGARERDLAARTQGQILQHSRSKVEDVQSHSDTVTTQPSPVWERSQEFMVSAGGQDVRVNFRAFYFSDFGSSRGYHHFEFFGHSTSPTGYRSDFLQIEQATSSWSSPTAYAQDKAQELHAELLKERRKQQRATKRRVKDG
jgi:hypothetical protein